MIKFKKLTQSGDTIVEVLIAVAVLSSVLGMAYATVSRNVARLRDNQERTESSKLAQGQIEALIGLWRVDRPQVESAGTTTFCIDSLSVSSISGGSFNPADSSADNVADFESANCTSTFYRMAIQRTSDDADTSTYRVYVRWQSISGLQNQVVYSHKLSKVNN